MEKFLKGDEAKPQFWLTIFKDKALCLAKASTKTASSLEEIILRQASHPTSATNVTK